MWDHETIMMIVQGVGETLYMTVLSTVLGYLFGLPMGVLLAVSDKEGLKPNAVLYKILDAIANIVRSIPFLILLILLIPFTRAVVGKSYGSTATVVPLVVAAIPFIARMVESSIKEVDAGVIEAARAMGASNIRIIVKVLLVEARTSLITGATIAIGTILGYSGMSVFGGFQRKIYFLCLIRSIKDLTCNIGRKIGAYKISERFYIISNSGYFVCDFISAFQTCFNNL